MDVVERDVPLSALYLAYIASIQPRGMGKFFLAEAARLSKSAHAFSKRCSLRKLLGRR